MEDVCALLFQGPGYQEDWGKCGCEGSRILMVVNFHTRSASVHWDHQLLQKDCDTLTSRVPKYFPVGSVMVRKGCKLRGYKGQ